MACVSEAIGLALPGSAGAPAPYESRDAYAEASGEAVMNLIASNLRPRDIVTRRALENAAMVVAASGGSTNAGCRSEEHTSELQSLMRISYAVFCLKKKNTKTIMAHTDHSQHEKVGQLDAQV